MLKRLLRILAAVAILIALSVLVPLAYIESTCRPASVAAASGAPTVALPAIDELKIQNFPMIFPRFR